MVWNHAEARVPALPPHNHANHEIRHHTENEPAQESRKGNGNGNGAHTQANTHAGLVCAQATSWITISTSIHLLLALTYTMANISPGVSFFLGFRCGFGAEVVDVVVVPVLFAVEVGATVVDAVVVVVIGTAVVVVVVVVLTPVVVLGRFVVIVVMVVTFVVVVVVILCRDTVVVVVAVAVVVVGVVVVVLFAMGSRNLSCAFDGADGEDEPQAVGIPMTQVAPASRNNRERRARERERRGGKGRNENQSKRSVRTSSGVQIGFHVPLISSQKQARPWHLQLTRRMSVKKQRQEVERLGKGCAERCLLLGVAAALSSTCSFLLSR